MDQRKKIIDVFNDEFEKQIKTHKTHKDAYEATENKFISRVGFNQYSSYESFKNARSKYMRKNKDTK